ncbi:MAG: ATP-binding protein [Holophaga sp.]|nr:ATP-binding protein [Holophaga sp.]
MISRPFWLQRIHQAWEEASIVWLCGVRRSGKTSLAGGLDPDTVLYLNCDLPAVEGMVADPELFFRSCPKPVVVFDEIHQLRDPSRILKIGADMFPHLKILATGSSTLAASRKFRDTLTGRKRTIHLLPVLASELSSFGGTSLPQRLFLGGLPPVLLAGQKQPAFFRDWMDSFFARDIQKLFGFRDMNRFNALFEFVLRQSGGQLGISQTAAALGISRPTVESHLTALEITHALTLVRPFHGQLQSELVKMPKAYAFDTGFVSFARGWDPLRPEDLGILWEHLVLEQLQARFPDLPVQYWRDKAGREVDFLLVHGRDRVDAIECKWDPAALDPRGLKVFREQYPAGRNFLVTPSGLPAHVRRFGTLEVRVCGLDGLGEP